MDFIKISVVPKAYAEEELKTVIREMYDKDVLDYDTETTITQLFEDLSDELTICFEYPYVDKVYRDSYYHYFASKHNSYYRDCIRITIFNTIIQPKFFRGTEYHQILQTSFLGYFVIRPTFPRIIGRTLIDKRALSRHNFIICQSKGGILINGMKLFVEGFPFSSQDMESISCAETSVWAIMEYFGTRYPEYRPTLPSGIINVLNRYSNQRMLPSNGLTVEQISFALKEFGFGTYVYARDVFKNEFENIIAAYVESGIPVVATIQNENVNHAILIVGHENDTHTKTNQSRKLNYPGKKLTYVDYSDITKKYVIQDDNLTPYKLIDLGNPAEHYDGQDDNFAGCIIESIVVPLYSKIYLEAVTAKQLTLTIASDSEYGYLFSKNFIFRFFLASSRSFKNHLASLTSLDPVIQNTLVLTKMPKFVWCGEFYQKEDFKQNRAMAIVVLDATEASENEQETLIFAGYPDRCIIKAGKTLATLNYKFNIYTKFKNNLA